VETNEVVAYPGDVTDSVRQVLRDVETVRRCCQILPDHTCMPIRSEHEGRYLERANDVAKNELLDILGSYIDLRVDVDNNYVEASISLPLIRDKKFAELQEEIDDMRQRALTAEAEVARLENRMDKAVDEICQLRLSLWYERLPFWKKWFAHVNKTGKRL